jgi:transcription elongation factor Elf1
MKESSRAMVRCANCGLTDELPTEPAFQEIDIYCRFTDKIYARKIGA